MGPFKDEPWIRKTDSPQAIIGFKATVYGVTFFLVSLILSFFVLAEVESVTFADRLHWSLIASISLSVLYLVWRSPTMHPGRMLLFVGQGIRIWVRNFIIMGKGLWPVLKDEETKRVVLDAGKTTVMLMFIIANALNICTCASCRTYSTNNI